MEFFCYGVSIQRYYKLIKIKIGLCPFFPLISMFCNVIRNRNKKNTNNKIKQNKKTEKCWCVVGWLIGWFESLPTRMSATNL